MRARIVCALVAFVVTPTAGVVLAPGAAASVVCSAGYDYTVVNHWYGWKGAGSTKIDNQSGSSVTYTRSVQESHTDTYAVTGSFDASAKAGFWKFASVSASAKLGLTLESADTISTTESVSFTIPAHSTRTLTWGWRRLGQEIQRSHLVNATPSTCRTIVDDVATVTAPYQHTYLVSG